MYLSRLRVRSDKWLQNVQRVHSRLCLAFPTPEKRERDPLFLERFCPGDFFPRVVNGKRLMLFRVDSAPLRQATILVQSSHEPDWNYTFQNVPELLVSSETRSYRPSLKEGSVFQFRLRANPTRKQKVSGEKQGKRTGILKEEDRHQWMEKKAEAGGFKLLRCSISPVVRSQGCKGQTEGFLKFDGTCFTGTLEVIDSSLFVQTLENGIGSGKAYGFGLLSVV